MNTLHRNAQYSATEQHFDGRPPIDSPAGKGGMSTRFMRTVDHWLGLPMCFVLGVFSRLFRRPAPPADVTLSGERPIAVFKFFGLGSIVLASPLLRALAKRHPNARLVFVTFESNRKLLQGLGYGDCARTIRTSSLLLFAGDVIRLVGWLRKSRVEAVIDLEFFSKFSTLLSVLSGAPARVGFHLNDFWRHSLLTHPVYFNYYHHMTDILREIAGKFDADLSDLQPCKYDPPAAAKATVRQFLEDRDCNDDTLLVSVNVNAGDLCLERRWSLDRFARLIEQLLEDDANMRIVLTGSAEERAYVQQLVDQLSVGAKQRTIIAAGAWNLDEFVAALSHLVLMVTNDSGPMHLAVACGVPTVSLWGPGRPAFYAPKADHHITIYTHYPCSPCIYMFTTFEGMWCNHEGWCMQAIELDEVLRATRSLLPPAADASKTESQAVP